MALTTDILFQANYYLPPPSVVLYAQHNESVHLTGDYKTLMSPYIIHIIIMYISTIHI